MQDIPADAFSPILAAQIVARNIPAAAAMMMGIEAPTVSIKRGQRGDQRPCETHETCVVLLITQRPMVASAPLRKRPLADRHALAVLTIRT